MAYNPYSLRASGSRRDVAPDPDVVTRWTYKTEDAIETVNTDGYIKDASTRGMRVGDIVEVVTMSAGSPSTWNQCMVTAITSGAANLSNGVAIAVTDSD